MFRGVAVSSIALLIAVFTGELGMRVFAGRPVNVPAPAVIGLMMSLLFGVAATLVGWPVLRALRTSGRPVIALATLAFAAVPLAGFVLLLRDGDDPKSLAGFLRFWWHVPGEFLAGFLPFVIASCVLAWFATNSVRPNSRMQRTSARRDV